MSTLLLPVAAVRRGSPSFADCFPANSFIITIITKGKKVQKRKNRKIVIVYICQTHPTIQIPLFSRINNKKIPVWAVRVSWSSLAYSRRPVTFPLYTSCRHFVKITAKLSCTDSVQRCQVLGASVLHCCPPSILQYFPPLDSPLESLSLESPSMESAALVVSPGDQTYSSTYWCFLLKERKKYYDEDFW